MKKLFDILFLDEAFEFLQTLEKKHVEKILFNIRRAQTSLDSELLKKMNDDLWEFRTQYQGLQYRFLAFWDKTNTQNTLIISTHGFIKKQNKTPRNEITKANRLRTAYFENKNK